MHVCKNGSWLQVTSLGAPSTASFAHLCLFLESKTEHKFQQTKNTKSAADVDAISGQF
jgi:hypothetical protein